MLSPQLVALKAQIEAQPRPERTPAQRLMLEELEKLDASEAFTKVVREDFVLGTWKGSGAGCVCCGKK
jgi:hypothetical protein